MGSSASNILLHDGQKRCNMLLDVGQPDHARLPRYILTIEEYHLNNFLLAFSQRPHIPGMSSERLAHEAFESIAHHSLADRP